MDNLLVLKKPLKGKRSFFKYKPRGPKFTPASGPVPPDPGVNDDHLEVPEISFVKLYAELCEAKSRQSRECGKCRARCNSPVNYFEGSHDSVPADSPAGDCPPCRLEKGSNVDVVL